MAVILFQADARIDPGLQQIDDQIDDHISGGAKEGHAHDGGIIDIEQASAR